PLDLCFPILKEGHVVIGQPSPKQSWPKALCGHGLPPEKSCQIPQFKSLSPREMEAFTMAKDTYEKSMLQKKRKCSSKFFHRGWDFRQLQVRRETLFVLEAELKLTLEVLKGIQNPELQDVLIQPLQTLSHIYREIQSCVTPLPSRGHRLPGRPNNWLHRLTEAGKVSYKGDWASSLGCCGPLG
uniref:Uncharacterized protein n=1 Tax=Monodelphis domestica TaxID=13616 RepID=F6W920_MONDO